MRKLHYSIYIYLLFGSPPAGWRAGLCPFDFAHGREPVERLDSLIVTKKMYDNAINVLREQARKSNERKKIHTFLKGMV